MATYNNIKKIKIGDNVFNLYDSGNSGGTITSVKTTAGAHTAINVTSGAANFNVPTKTSHLTNDSGFITSYTDTKNTAGSTDTSSKIYLIGATEQSANPQTYSHDTVYVDTNGCLYNNGYEVLTTNALEDIASIDDLPTITLNGSETVSPTFYAPTTAGTSGYYLKSSGSGAPTWASIADSDKKLSIATVTSGTTYYPIVGTGEGAATRQYDSSGFKYYSVSGDDSTIGQSSLTLGNSGPSTSIGNKQGQLIIYGSSKWAHSIEGAPTASRTLTLPDATGTIALTSDLSNYLPLSGGTMTGNIIMNGLGILGKSSINDNANYLLIGLNKTDNYIYVGSGDGRRDGIPIGIYGSNIYLGTGGDLTLSGYIHLPNLSSNGGLKIANSSGNYYRALYCTASNSLVLGYDWYAEEGGKIGQTYIGGSQLFLRSPDGPITATADINATGFKATRHGGGTGDDGYIGDVIGSSKTSGLSTLSKSSTDYTSTGATFTLGAGSWIIVAQVRFPAKAGGNRKVALKVGTTTYNASRNTCSSPTASAIDLLTSVCVAISSSSTVDILGWQNSDSDLTPTQVYWRAIRIA